MPSFSQHSHQAEHNQELLTLLAKQDLCKKFSDWYVTISFYSSVYYVEGIINKIGKFYVKDETIYEKNSESIKHSYGVNSEHQARKLLMKDNIKIFAKIYNAHQTLYEMSRTARYKCHHPEGHNYINVEKCLNDVNNEFIRITKQ